MHPFRTIELEVSVRHSYRDVYVTGIFISRAQNKDEQEIYMCESFIVNKIVSEESLKWEERQRQKQLQQHYLRDGQKQAYKWYSEPITEVGRKSGEKWYSGNQKGRREMLTVSTVNDSGSSKALGKIVKGTACNCWQNVCLYWSTVPRKIEYDRLHWEEETWTGFSKISKVIWTERRGENTWRERHNMEMDLALFLFQDNERIERMVHPEE